MYKPSYVIGFATLICFICSIVLALIATGLKPLQDYNIAADQKKNILKAVGLLKGSEKILPEDVEKSYVENIDELFLNKMGETVAGKTLEEAKLDPNLLILYKRKDNGTIAFQVEGMGLWSLLQGYFALEKDGHTVAGITFYEQKETAGLGAEISKDWFVNNFVKKDILDKKGKLVSITVVKGKVENFPSLSPDNIVDGISGATMTSRGVTNLIQVGLDIYKPYLKKLWKSSGI